MHNGSVAWRNIAQLGAAGVTWQLIAARNRNGGANDWWRPRRNGGRQPAFGSHRRKPGVAWLAGWRW
jgi:hypothetical protein